MGGLLSDNARMDSELSRRNGSAKGVFLALRAVWNHSGLGIQDKIKFFRSLVVSRLVYGLSSCWLVKGQLRRLEGFYARSLRTILRIPAAYVSRISNKTVLDRAGLQSIGEQLRTSQIALLAKTAQAHPQSPLRRNVFVGETLRPVAGYFIRRVGRPRQDWTNSLLNIGAALYNGRDNFERHLLTLKIRKKR